jgi:hypothetical protein
MTGRKMVVMIKTMMVTMTTTTTMMMMILIIIIIAHMYSIKAAVVEPDHKSQELDSLF